MVRQKQGPAGDAPRSLKRFPRECFWRCFLCVFFEVRLERTAADKPSCAAPQRRLGYTVRWPARLGDTGDSPNFEASQDVFSGPDAPRGLEKLPRILMFFLYVFGGAPWAHRPGHTLLHSFATSPWSRLALCTSPLIGINYLELVYASRICCCG